MALLYADIEADGLYRDLTRVWCVGLAEGPTEPPTVYADQPGYPPISEALRRLKSAGRVVFHNGLNYDAHVINRFWPGTIEFDQIVDTLVMSRLLDPDRRTHNLADWGEQLGHAKPEHENWSRFSDDMAHRCSEDVVITRGVHQYLAPRLEDWGDSVRLEHQFAWVMAIQEHHGFRLDVDKCIELIGGLRTRAVAIEEELQTVWLPRYEPVKANWDYRKRKWSDVDIKSPARTELFTKAGKPAATKFLGDYSPVRLTEFNPGSRTQIARRLSSEYGWRPRKKTPSGEPQIDDAVLGELEYPAAKLLAESFDLHKQLGQLVDGKNGWLKHERDGRVHGSINTVGAHTGRCAHFAPNMGQVDKRLREVWVADEGMVLVGCDAEGLELRMLASFLYSSDDGAYARAVVDGSKEDGTDAHSRTRDIVQLAERNSAKTFIYALIYGAGDFKLGSIFKDDQTAAGRALTGSPAENGKTLRRRVETGITGLGRLTKQAKHRHKTRGFITGLDGRKLFTRSDHSALNTLLQGGGAVLMKKALVIFWFDYAVDRGWVDTDYYPVSVFPVANVHDEQQFCTPQEIAEDVGQTFSAAITAAGEALGLKCPMAGSHDIGSNWMETH